MVFCWALALSICPAPTPQPPTPTGAIGWSSGAAPPLSRLINASLVRAIGGAYKTVKRCAVGRARRLIQRGIDPGFIHLEGGNPLLGAGRAANSPQSRNCQGAALIRRKLCGGEWEGLQVHSGDQFLSQSVGGVWHFPLAPCGRGALHSSGVRGRPSKRELLLPLGLLPLPLEGGGWEGVDGPSTSRSQPIFSKLDRLQP